MSGCVGEISDAVFSSTLKTEKEAVQSLLENMIFDNKHIKHLPRHKDLG